MLKVIQVTNAEETICKKLSNILMKPKTKNKSILQILVKQKNDADHSGGSRTIIEECKLPEVLAGS